MPKTKEEKRKAKRKLKQKEMRRKFSRFEVKDRAEDLFYEAMDYVDDGNLEKALAFLEKAVHLDPKNGECLREMWQLGVALKRYDVQLAALEGLYRFGALNPKELPGFCNLLTREKAYERALQVVDETLSLFQTKRLQGKKKMVEELEQIRRYCLHMLASADKTPRPANETRKKEIQASPPAKGVKQEESPSTPSHAPAPLPEIPLSVDIDPAAFEKAFSSVQCTSLENYDLALDAQRIRFRETFDNLLSLRSLRQVDSFWYQEETARKVLKTFRGRALLSDEVGLGKTIEALIVLKEYIMRGLVRTALILTPTPLVSQWKEELRSKFDLNFPSTDDMDYRSKPSSLWKENFALASINIAKSRRNFAEVTEREYDMVIVDEAHHLKNRNTLNWKLVNSLKKRFLLFLTATPVENNLMELYNLVTLPKPGQLKTASGFREQFMTRGDPTDPQNRSQLRDLLNQVMIRNTRALARINIPPRFAQIFRIPPDPPEMELYERLSALVRDVNARDGTTHRLLLKNLLEEAGSSPRAIGLSLIRLREKKDGVINEYEKEILSLHRICESLQGSSKNRFLLDLLKRSPEKMIIFVKYIGTLDHVSAILTQQGIGHALFHGRMDNREKEQQIAGFREHQRILVTTEIGGEGRNLQFCHQMLNYDLTWNPMKIEQRIGRIHRIGQEKEVMIYNFCGMGSIEDYILQILDKKINMFEMVIGEIDMILGRIEGEQEFSEMVYDIWLKARSDAERAEGFNRLASQLKRAKTGYQKTKDLDQKLFGEDYEL